jgi:ATP-dependent protease ClpP protease subunit
MPRKSWFRITNQAGGPGADLWLYDEIGCYGITASDLTHELAEITAAEINVHINSRGGEVFDGIAIYECLKAHPSKVICHIDALAASIASVVAMAGDEIIMGRSAQMMIHNAAGSCWGTAKDMDATAAVLRGLSDTIAGIYEARCGKTKADWQELMDAESWFFAQQAVDAGLADRLADPKERPTIPQPTEPIEEPEDEWNDQLVSTAILGFRYADQTRSGD